MKLPTTPTCSSTWATACWPRLRLRMTLCVCSSGERPCWLVASNRRALIRTAATESARVCRANPPSHAASNSAIPSRTEPSRAKPSRAEASMAPAHPSALYPSLPPHNTQPSRAEAISSRRNDARQPTEASKKGYAEIGLAFRHIYELGTAAGATASKSDDAAGVWSLLE